MKGLLEIEQQVRELENKLAEMTGCVKNIRSDMEGLRREEQPAPLDEAAITRLAKRLPFQGHPLSGRTAELRRLYLTMLLSVIRLRQEPPAFLDGLVFVRWVQLQTKEKASLEELLIASYRLKDGDYQEMVETVLGELRENFMVDALIVANLGGPADRETCAYLADLAAVLDIRGERMSFLAAVSRAALCQDADIILKWQGWKGTWNRLWEEVAPFGYYISREQLMKAGECGRQIIMKRKVDDIYGVIWQEAQGAWVEEGEVIVTFYENSIRGQRMQRVSAPAAGTLFHFHSHGFYYAVLTYRGDSPAAIRAWVELSEK